MSKHMQNSRMRKVLKWNSRNRSLFKKFRYLHSGVEVNFDKCPNLWYASNMVLDIFRHVSQCIFMYHNVLKLYHSVSRCILMSRHVSKSILRNLLYAQISQKSYDVRKTIGKICETKYLLKLINIVGVQYLW